MSWKIIELGNDDRGLILRTKISKYTSIHSLKKASEEEFYTVE